MITEQELMAVTDRKERFELSMLYMHLHGMPPYLDPLTLDDVRQIRNAVLHVTQGMDYTSMKEGLEYFNVETGDNAYKAMQELKKKQSDEMAQRQMIERLQREADKEAARTFRFSHMDRLNDADGLTVTQIVTEIVKAQALHGSPFLVVDDLCDGGGTFARIAQVLRERYPDRQRRIFVTHMVNVKGIGVLADNYDQVTFTNSFRDWKAEIGQLPDNVRQIDVDKEWRFV